jgi:hypothetical protein
MDTELRDSLFNDSVFEVLGELNRAVIAAAHMYVEREKQNDGRFTEQQRRQRALESIDEVLDWRPLSAFKAVQLEFLELLICNWRECEVETGAPEPDSLPQQ